VTPDLSIVPNKYHTFISPPLRRVFLDTREDNSRAVIENLNAENAALKERVTLLERDKDLLTDRCNAAHSTVARLSVEYDAFKSRARNHHHFLALFSIFILVSAKMYYSRSVGLQ
jgi:hypothetical protein